MPERESAPAGANGKRDPAGEAANPAAGEAANPIVACVTRADRVESVHRGFGAAVEPDGSVVAAFGDPETPIFWRSAAKPFQVMPFLESGGAERFGLSLDEIAVACASHVGSPAHVAAVESVLAKGGFSVADLRCGAHPPYDDASAAALVRQGIPFSALHNNCSGKHAAMLLACRLFGFDPATYDAPGHPLQGRILEKIAFYADFPAERIGIGVDGCSLPVFRLPVSRLAAAYARLLVSAALPQEAAPAFAARRRVVEAMTAAPFFVSGAGQFTTRFIEAGAGRWIGKEGAEGVYAIGVAAPVPLGLAFKIDDGGARARNPVAVDLLSRLGVWSEVPASLAGEVRPPITNVRGSAVGEVVVAVPVTASGRPPRAARDPSPRPVAARERA